MSRSLLGACLGGLILVAGAVLVALGWAGNEILADRVGLRPGSDLPVGVALCVAALLLVVFTTDRESRRVGAVPEPAPPRPDENARYQDLGRWARHFSTVRMTVATFLTTAAVGIVLKALDYRAGSPHRQVLLGITEGFLVLMMVLFTGFTMATYKRVNDQRQLVSRDPVRWQTDPAFLLVTAVFLVGSVLMFHYLPRFGE